ncbi:MAG: hypothetical protein M1820_003942 [Bogoriella megaspora]|nr:MAG: hypothetical protein M1820_003942 [Bogoriella megaspora]
MLIYTFHLGAYNRLRGQFLHPTLGFSLSVDHIQGDAYAPPSRVRTIIGLDAAGIPAVLTSERIRRVAFGDYLTRNVAKLIEGRHLDRNAKGTWSGPKGGAFRINAPGQQVIDRNSCVIKPDESTIELRFTVSLPAKGRTILGKLASNILTDAVPGLVQRILIFSNLNLQDVEHHVQSVEDQDYMRSQLAENGLVAFVANGSILPRAGGPFGRPMTGSKVIPFQIDPANQMTLQRKHRGAVTGLGIPVGVTVLTGGGFHGKSTLLEALELGIYNHIPGDGREAVVSDPTAVKIRAEDSRSITQTDISPFITNLPGSQDTHRFTTADASGSTSMAANIQEALEVGCRTLLIDEDTSATNLLVRDERMQALIRNEPITPMVSKVEALKNEHGVSTIIVVGGLGDWLSVADNVIVMDLYRPSIQTDEAKSVSQQHPSKIQVLEHYGQLPSHIARVPSSVSQSKGPMVKRKDFIIVPGLNQPELRTATDAEPGIDLSGIDQLVETGQTRLLAAILSHLASSEQPISFREIAKDLETALAERGLASANPHSPVAGEWVAVRGLEMAAMLCRIRGLEVG